MGRAGSVKMKQDLKVTGITHHPLMQPPYKYVLTLTLTLTIGKNAAATTTLMPPTPGAATHSDQPAATKRAPNLHQFSSSSPSSTVDITQGPSIIVAVLLSVKPQATKPIPSHGQWSVVIAWTVAAVPDDG